MKKVAILQSNYIPWKGYFDLIASVDEFILYDDMQYTRRDWRNRNLIKTPQGLHWLTIPVAVKGKFHQRINETLISDPDWAKAHWQVIERNYSRSAYFKEYREQVRELYLDSTSMHLSEINHRFLTSILELLGVKTKVSWSSDYTLEGERSSRLLSLCQQAKAQVYISGPAARDYLDTEIFTRSEIEVEWMDYSGYPTYRQQYGDFEHGVSILDLIFNEGPDSPTFMKCITPSASA